MKEITSLQTHKIIGKMGNSQSLAHDNLDSMMIKHGAEVLHKPITHLINLTIRKSKIPIRWKIGKNTGQDN